VVRNGRHHAHPHRLGLLPFPQQRASHNGLTARVGSTAVITFHTCMAVLACERATAVGDVGQQDNNACVIDQKKRVGAISRGRAAAA
jgi:hypothetical protein